MQLANLPKIILASTSPRRKQLLELSDIEFKVLAVEIDETIRKNESPIHYIKRMTALKSKHAVNNLCSLTSPLSDTVRLNSPQNTIIITADTIGVLPDGATILVKPQDDVDAYNMWGKMSGRTHEVWTSVQLAKLNSTGKILQVKTILEKTTVTFIELTQDDMHDYWLSGEPKDKAGGYAIQGKGALWVSRINGSYTNVVGLPLSQTVTAIKQMCL